MKNLTAFSSILFIGLFNFYTYADGLPCHLLDDQIHFLFVNHSTSPQPSPLILPTGESVYERQMQDFYKGRFRFAAEQYILEMNSTAATRLTLEETDLVIRVYDAIYFQLGQPLDSTLDCSPLLQLSVIEARKYQNTLSFLEKLERENFNFSPDISYYSRSENTSSVKNEDEWEHELLRSINTDIIIASNDSDEATPFKERLKKLRQFYYRKLRELESKNLEVMSAQFMKTLSLSLDPHTEYYTPKQARELMGHLQGNASGIGAVLSFDEEYTTIASIVIGGSAHSLYVEHQGTPQSESRYIKKDDVVLAISQDGKEWKSTSYKDAAIVTNEIRGEEGTTVYLKIQRIVNNEKKEFIVPIKRSSILSSNDLVKSSIHIASTYPGQDKKVGVIKFASFYSESENQSGIAAKIKDILIEFKAKNVDSVVLDVRSNGGGSLEEVVKIVQLFINAGRVVAQANLTEPRIVEYLEGTVDDIGVLYSGPLVIAIDRYSASASEILAGALKSYKRALIVGAEKTFGKGTVQTVFQNNPRQSFPVVDTGMSKATIGAFYIPNGQSTQFQGVRSDIIFPQISQRHISEEAEKGEEKYSNALKIAPISDFTDSAKAQGSSPEDQWVPINEDLITDLRASSSKRIEGNSYFKFVREHNRRATGLTGNKKVADYLEHLDWTTKAIEAFKTNDELKEMEFREKGLILGASMLREFNPASNGEDAEIIELGAELSEKIRLMSNLESVPTNVRLGKCEDKLLP